MTLLWFAVKQRSMCDGFLAYHKGCWVCFVVSWFSPVSSDEHMSKWLLKVKNITSSDVFSLKCEFIFIPSQKHPHLQFYLGSFFNLPLPLFI